MTFPFKQAKHFRAGGNTPVNRIVIHTAEFPEKPKSAKAIADYFARGTVRASAHYVIDDVETWQCVLDHDIAYHAPPNTGSLGLEHIGFARQTPAEWADPFSTAMLERSATLTALLCREHDLPVVWLSVADLRAGGRGITSHNNVSLAFGQSSHTDPGPHFPVDHYLARVRAHLHPTPTTEGDPDMFTVQVLDGPEAGYYVVFNGYYWTAIGGAGGEAESYLQAKIPHVRHSASSWTRLKAKAHLIPEPD